MKKLFLLLALSCFLVFIVPAATCDAAGLVPCTGVVGDECEFCDFAQLIHNVIAWLATILGIIAVLLIIYSGVRLLVSVGSVEAKSAAKRILITAVVGYILFLSAAFFVDFIMKVLLTNQNYGVWDSISCESQPQTN